MKRTPKVVCPTFGVHFKLAFLLYEYFQHLNIQDYHTTPS